MRKLIVSAGAALLAGTAAAVALPAGAEAAGCAVQYGVPSQWPGGFNADVTVTNLGDPLTSWNLTWSYGAGQTVAQAWNAAVTQSGAGVSARNVAHNGAVPTGGSVSFGFTGTWTGSNPSPTSFAVNGVTCTGGTTPSGGTPSVSPSTGPPATADITVNTATRHQTIDGFGAAVSIWGGAWSAAETQTLVGLGPGQLGLSIVRTGISPVSSEWPTHVNALKTAKSYGSGVKILASPWTAPAAWKTNNSRINGGKLRTDFYDDYAGHLSNYVQYMRGQGVGIDVTSVQNEPDWHPDYDSMDWSGTELRNFVRDQGAKVQNTKLMVAEAVNLNYGYTDPVLNDTTARNNIGYIGGHLYGTEESGRLKSYPLAGQHNKPVWMTEWNLHEADGSGSNIWGNRANPAIWNETLDDIMRTVHRSMESNWSAYIWWYGKRYYSSSVTARPPTAPPPEPCSSAATRLPVLQVRTAGSPACRPGQEHQGVTAGGDRLRGRRPGHGERAGPQHLHRRAHPLTAPTPRPAVGRGVRPLRGDITPATPRTRTTRPRPGNGSLDRGGAVQPQGVRRHQHR
ncbi:cellulose binding domain-containing protein [Actinoplanes sp. NPDC023801]|uniref:cellulose binding domain-containing protein n=1 Tax=Actinoplanes sp. NPDC023801 TaxID=3154595 RepID=UPI0033CDC353